MTTCENCHQEIDPTLLIEDAVRNMDHGIYQVLNMPDADNSLGYSRQRTALHYLESAKSCLGVAKSALPRGEE